MYPLIQPTFEPPPRTAWPMRALRFPSSSGSAVSTKREWNIYTHYGTLHNIHTTVIVTTYITAFRPPLDRPPSPLVQLWLHLSTPCQTLSMGVDRGLWTHVCPRSSSCGYMCLCHVDTVRLAVAMSVYARRRILPPPIPEFLKKKKVCRSASGYLCRPSVQVGLYRSTQIDRCNCSVTEVDVPCPYSVAIHGHM
jgi:hypothetical protein